MASRQRPRPLSRSTRTPSSEQNRFRRRRRCGRLRGIGRARQWAAALEAGEAAGPKALADELGMDRSNLAKELVLATISPRVVRRILAGDLPNDLSLAKLRALRTTVWSEQERALGLA